ncbi:MAG: dephospho-CoA kinase [Candidatus Bipolaricaulota bacterium]|nr:dephospho-CoA kinase [Candidatus Bipolaricaulota bacterium]
MRVVGVAGPSGAGKSTLARLLARRPGFAHLDCDALAWAAYAPGGPAYAALVARFGKGILAPDGTVDRGRLAQAALASPEGKADLEAIVHPVVVDGIRRAIEEHRAAGTGVLLVEGALLLASPHVDRALFDLVLWVEVPEEERRRRLLGAGLAPEAVERRLQLQRGLQPPADPRVRVLHGSGAPAAVAERAAALLKEVFGGLP